MDHLHTDTHTHTCLMATCSHVFCLLSASCGHACLKTHWEPHGLKWRIGDGHPSCALWRPGTVRNEARRVNVDEWEVRMRSENWELRMDIPAALTDAQGLSVMRSFGSEAASADAHERPGAAKLRTAAPMASTSRYRNVRQRSHPADSHSFIGMARETAAMPPALLFGTERDTHTHGLHDIRYSTSRQQSP